MNMNQNFSDKVEHHFIQIPHLDKAKANEEIHQPQERSQASLLQAKIQTHIWTKIWKIA